MNQKVVCRAALRNISPGGLGFEILPKPVHKNMQVFVQIDSPRLDIGLILCTVQWVAEMEGNPNKMVGLRINKITPSLQKKMEIAFNFSMK